LPVPFRDVALRHHEPPDSGGLVALVQAACLLADDIGFAAVLHADRCDPLERIVMMVPEPKQAGIVKRWQSVHQQIFDRVESLDF
jgi:hypothetical protein